MNNLPVCCRPLFFLLFPYSTLFAQTDWEAVNRQIDSLEKAKSYKQSIPIIEKWADLAVAELGERDTMTARLWSRLGFAMLAAGQPDKAENWLRKGLETRLLHFPPEEENCQSTRRNLGMALQTQGKLVQSEKAFEESLEYYLLDSGPRDTVGWRRTLRRLAATKAQAGKFTAADALFEECRDLYVASTKVDSMDWALFLSDWGFLAFEKGDYQLAETRLRTCRDIQVRKKGRITEDFAQSQANLAALYAELGDFDLALAAHGEAAEVLEAMPNLTPKSRIVLINRIDRATWLNGSGRWVEAEKAALAVLPDAVETIGKENALYLRILSELLYSRRNLGGMDSVEELANEAEQLSLRLNGERHTRYFTSLANRGVVSETVGKIEEAEKCYRRHFELVLSIYPKTHEEPSKSAMTLAAFLGRTNRIDEAEALYAKWAPVALEVLEHSTKGFSEKLTLGAVGQAQGRFFGWLEFGASKPELKTRWAERLLDQRLAMRGLAFSANQRLRAETAENTDPTFQKAFFDWLTMREQLAKAYLLSQSDLDKQGLSLIELEEKALFLETDLVRQSPAMADFLKNQRPDWRDIQRRLGPDEALVEVVKVRRQSPMNLPEGRDAYAFFILTAETVERPELLFLENGKQLEGIFLRQCLAEILDTSRLPTSQAFEHFWAPIAPFLEGKKIVWLSPDGVYAQLNPSAFRLPDGRFLLDATDVRLISHPSDLLKNEPKKNEPNAVRSALVIGNPAFDLDIAAVMPVRKSGQRGQGSDFVSNLGEVLAEDGFDLRALPFSGDEARQIDHFLKSRGWASELLLEKSATETRLKSSHRPDILHLATHSYSLAGRDQVAAPFGKSQLRRDPMASSMLFFAGSKQTLFQKQRGDDDGIFTGIEATNLDLRGTELVALSTCDSQRGISKMGEGSVLGLLRAFRMAGAASVLATLWRVDDAATSEFMPLFYENWLEKGLSKREALRQTQKTFAQKRPSPAFWAPFVLIGE